MCNIIAFNTTLSEKQVGIKLSRMHFKLKRLRYGYYLKKIKNYAIRVVVIETN